MFERVPSSRQSRARRPRRAGRPYDATPSASSTRPLPNDLRSALHDRLGPGLANLEVRLELLETAVTEPPLAADVTALRLQAGRLVSELRSIVHAEPPALLGMGLIPAVAEACRGAERPGLCVGFRVVGTPWEPPAGPAELLYRAALEGTANVTRHAYASRCSVTLRFGRAALSLQVSDDGIGPTRPAPAACADGRGLGLASLRRSARLLGGAAHLLPAPTGGSCLSVTLPLPPAVRPRRTRRSRRAGRYLP